MSNEAGRLSKNEQRALVPRLRFPEFSNSGNWTNLPVGRVLTVRDDRQVPTEDVPLYSLTIENGVTAKSDRYNREFLVQNGKKKYKVVRPGDIVYNPANLRWGAISTSAQSHSVVVSPIYEVLYVGDSSSYVSEYIDYAITRPWQITLFAEKGQGTLLERIAVNVDDFLNTPLPVPPTPREQRRIADCLGSLDDLIVAEGRELAALRDHKKGLMQQLFPREGETEPRLRFPEFRNGPEWRREQLGDIAAISKGKGLAKADIEAGGETPCVRYGELYTIYGEVIGEVRSRTNLPVADLVLSQAGDVIIPASGESKDDIATCACVMSAGVALGSDLNIIRSTVDGRFFSYYLNGNRRRELAKVAQGDTVAHLYPSQLSMLELYIPVEEDEQLRIADCLASLDAMIAAHAEKLEALRIHKRGLMQQLFPSPEKMTGGSN